MVVDIERVRRAQAEAAQAANRIRKAKTERKVAAIVAMRTEGVPVTKSAVARRAGVSRVRVRLRWEAALALAAA